MEARSLSPTEARVVLSLESEGKVDLTLGEIQRRARVSRGFARRLAHELVGKGWIQRVGRGRYLLTPSRYGPDIIPDTDPLRLGSRIAAPYYFGYATAAELHGLLPQAGRVYYVVTPRRGSSRWPHAAQFRRVRVSHRRFFGVQWIERRGERICVSDLDRTVLDCLTKPELSGGLGGAVQILHSAGARLDWARVSRYLARMGSRSLALRLGYLSEWIGPPVEPPRDWIERTRARPREPFVPLGGPKEFGRRGEHDARWHIIRNVPDTVLRAEVDVR